MFFTNDDELTSYWLTDTGASLYRVWKDEGSQNVLIPVLLQGMGFQWNVPRAGFQGAGSCPGSTGVGMFLGSEDYRNQLQVKMLCGRIVDNVLEVHQFTSLLGVEIGLGVQESPV